MPQSTPSTPKNAQCSLPSALNISGTQPTTQVPWPEYGADKASSRYAPLSQISASNFSTLQIAWTWSPLGTNVCEPYWAHANESTPILVDGVLYTSTSFSQVAAINAQTGESIWTYDPQAYLLNTPPNLGWVHRGVAYWEEGQDRRVFIGTGTAQLIALNADTGRPIPSFGRNGQIDLTQGLGRPVSRLHYGVSSPPIICGEVVVVGSSIFDFPVIEAMPPGDVRGFDIKTGAVRWTFETIPRSGQQSGETWQDGAELVTGGANPWAPLACDEQLGLLYLPTGTPTNDYYGGSRKGDNLFAESIVAVDVTNGEKRWHYQGVHHGLWDYDFPAAPNLVDLTVDGAPVKALAQVSKQAFVYVLNRETGEPIWPIPERMAPLSDIPGEQTSATQPIPTRPAPFDYQGISEETLIDFTPELRAEALEILSPFRYGPLFMPPSVEGTVMLPGIVGGASWSGATYHPGLHTLYIPSLTLPFVAQVRESPVEHTPSVGGSFVLLGPQGLPITKPPYSRITAIDLNTGNHLWMTPTGEGPTQHPALKDLNLGPLGHGRRSYAVATDTLLLVAQEGRAAFRSPSADSNGDTFILANDDATLRAYNLRTGALLGSVDLPGNATGGPMTYMIDNKQYIAVPIGGGGLPMQLVALTLP